MLSFMFKTLSHLSGIFNRGHKHSWTECGLAKGHVSMLTELQCSYMGQFLSMLASLFHAREYLCVHTVHSTLNELYLS